MIHSTDCPALSDCNLSHGFAHKCNTMCMLTHVWFFATPWTVTHQTPDGISQAITLEWVAISFSRESSWPRDQTCVSCISCIGRRIPNQCTTWETLDNKWIMSSTITLFIKLCKSHIKNFERSRKVLCFLVFGGICLLNLPADPLAWDTGNYGKQVFNRFSQAHEIERHYIYRGLCPQNTAAQSYITSRYHKWVRQDKPTWKRK